MITSLILLLLISFITGCYISHGIRHGMFRNKFYFAGFLILLILLVFSALRIKYIN